MKISPSRQDDAEARAFCLALSYLLDDGNEAKILLRRMALDTSGNDVASAALRRRANDVKEGARAGS